MSLEEALKVIMTNKDRIALTYDGHVLEIVRSVYTMNEDGIIFDLKKIEAGKEKG